MSKKESSKRQRKNNPYHIAREVGVFAKDLALDAAGELLDLGLCTLAGVSTLGLHRPAYGEFNFRRKSVAKPGRHRVKR